MNVRRAFLSGVMAIALVQAIPTAYAEDRVVGDSTAPLTELLRLNPGLGREELEGSIGSVSAETGMSKQEVVRKMLAEAREAIDPASTSFASSGGGGGGKTLGSAKQVGDVFYSPSNVQPHGHIGMYVSRTTVAEAPGLRKVTRTIESARLRVPGGSTKENVKISGSKAKAAGVWAKKRTGRKYNLNFALNRKVESNKYNCSQYVWAAFKSQGLELDKNKGLGVYPKDIRDHSRVVRYATIK